MKVITIGRSNENDVRIENQQVSRHHCQIVQHDDGSFSIVDFGSSNGTFVNGVRINGQVSLKNTDSVKVGNTELSWQKYFTKQNTKTTKPWLWPAVAGLALFVIIGVLLFFSSDSNQRDDSDAVTIAFKGEYPDAVTIELEDEDGFSYTIEAIEGQVCVWFNEGVSFKESKKNINGIGGEIVAQIPDIGYYLVQVPNKDVKGFLAQIKGLPGVEYASPNTVSYPCMANNYILDNFYPAAKKNDKDDTTPHGVIVRFAMQECGTQSTIDTFNIGSRPKNGQTHGSMCVFEKMEETCANNEVFALQSVSKVSVNNPMIINMSYGPYLQKRKDSIRYYWTNATPKEREDYKRRYLDCVRRVIKNVKPLKGRDFIITKAAGNDGVKEFDVAIISYLRSKLYPDELEVLDKHFLFVSAGEEGRIAEYRRWGEIYRQRMEENRELAHRYGQMRYDGYNNDRFEYYDSLYRRYDTLYRYYDTMTHFCRTYSNEMEEGHYNPWVTKVDISDFKYNGENRFGTSYAAPRAACILSSAVNKHNINASEVLKYAREATRLHPQHLLTAEMLDSLINADKGGKTSEYVDLGLPSGTLWKTQNEEGHYDYDGAVRRFGRHLPTKEQMEELLKQCRWTWTGEGYRVVGPNGKSITLPVSGYRQYESVGGGVEFTALNEAGWYWTSTTDGPRDAWFLKFFSETKEMSSYDRSEEFSVRLVKGGTRTTNEKPVIPSQSQMDLTGTVWVCERQYEYEYYKLTLEFLSNNRYRITKFSSDIVGEETKTDEGEFHFREGKNDWIIGRPDGYRSQAFCIRNDLLIVYDIISGPDGTLNTEYKRVR